MKPALLALRRWPLSWRVWLAVLLPGLLSALLIALSFTHSLRTLTDSSTSWTGQPYQMLASQLALVLLQSEQGRPRTLDGVSLAERVDLVRATFENKAREFGDLAEVERLGPARLARVERLFEAGTRGPGDRARLLRALLESQALLGQARDRLNNVREGVYRQTRQLQVALTVFGALGVIALGALVARFVQMWRAERQLRAQQAKLSHEVSLMASHELRRPLQHLALVADLLQHDHMIGEAERARLFQKLQDSAAQLAVLSDLSRLEAVYADPRLERAPHDLAELLAALARPRVVLNAPAGLVWSVDRTRLAQALENVLENALKYAPGEVCVTLARGALGPEVHVVDRGPGVPPQDRERVFEPFYRAPGTNASGHGLGLAIARRFVRAHGGDITLQDEPGGGTRVVLALVSAPSKHPEKASRRAPRTVRIPTRG